MKAERTLPRTHFEAHFSRDGDLADSRKGPRTSSVEGSLPSSLAKQWHRLQSVIACAIAFWNHRLKSVPLRNRYFDCQKTKRAGFKLPREAARSFNSREFCFEIWEREPLPLIYCVIRRLSIDVSCSSLPPKILFADNVRPNEQTTACMAQGCHFVACFL